MLSAYDDHTSSLGACPVRMINPKEERKRSKKSRKKIAAAAMEAEAKAQNNRRNNTDSVPVPENDDIRSGQYGSQSVEFNSSKRKEKKSSSHRNKGCRQLDQQNLLHQDRHQYPEYHVDLPEPEQNLPRQAPEAPQPPAPRGQAAEMRLYLDKLRELVPQLPKKGKVPRMQLIQHTIDYICDLQQALEDHPRLRGLDPRVIAAPGNVLSPMQIQRQLLQQLQQQQQQQQQMLQQQQQYYSSTPHFNTPYSRTPLAPLPSGHPRLILQARRETKMASLRSALRSSTTGAGAAPPPGPN